MTENLAGRGEGLAGRIAEALEKYHHFVAAPRTMTYRQAIAALAKLLAKELEAAAPAGTAPRIPDDLVREIIADALIGSHGYGGSLARARIDIANRIEKWLAALKYYASHADGGTGVAEAALATPSPATASANLSVADLKPLKDACDRDWKDESPLQIICIAANAIYWRDVELSVLKGSPDYANGFNAGRESLSTPLTPYGDEKETAALTAEDVESSILFSTGTFIDYAIAAASLNRKVRERLLGSPRKVGEDGALREALEHTAKLFHRSCAYASHTSAHAGAAFEDCMEVECVENRRVLALSLSSPIEPAGDTLWQRCLSLVERCREKTPDKWDFAHELAEICKGYSRPTSQASSREKVVRIRKAWAEFLLHLPDGTHPGVGEVTEAITAALTGQASSEVREALAVHERYKTTGMTLPEAYQRIINIFCSLAPRSRREKDLGV